MVCVLAYFITAIQGSMFAKELTGGRKMFFAVALFAIPAASRAATNAMKLRSVGGNAARDRPTHLPSR